ncbi:hypothetical protein [Streptosporangium roseum]|uniref:hypothetical protein n=1 Tax=Streptosporangium roseum TaxID=2001 RepID=UPI0004CCC415|nr:hypothetical protein [Streptosporangium roseum]
MIIHIGSHTEGIPQPFISIPGDSCSPSRKYASKIAPLAPHLDQLAGSVGLAAIEAFSIGVWHVREDAVTLAGLRKKDPVLTLRRIFVHSSARAQAAATARAKKLERARDDLARLERGPDSRHYPDEQAVADRTATIGRTRRGPPT